MNQSEQPPPMSAWARRHLALQWKQFVNEHVYMDNGIYNRLPRAEAIRVLIDDFLNPIIVESGYVWKTTSQSITNKLLHIMFHMWRGRNVDIINYQRGYSMEHYERFLHTMNEYEWDRVIWGTWNFMEDFTEGGYAQNMRHLLIHFVWNMLDLSRSAVTAEIIEEVEERSAYEDSLRAGNGDVTKGKDDPYLQDISKSTYEERRGWF